VPTDERGCTNCGKSVEDECYELWKAEQERELGQSGLFQYE